MVIENERFDEERAFYASSDITVRNCEFSGEADGESAFKESKNVVAEGCKWELRYPFWHDDGVRIFDTELTVTCRAAFWYSENIVVEKSKLHGTKALRECENVNIKNSDIISSEFGWYCKNIFMKSTCAVGEYFMMRSSKLLFEDVSLNGKYSFQYITDCEFENCNFNTKDAFWHAKRVTVKNSTVNGEYLAWYAEDITFINCKIIGTQPFCYCKGLKLVECEMIDADLAFEKSSVEATLTAPVVSIKNPTSGYIRLPSCNEVIMSDTNAKCEITVTGA